MLTCFCSLELIKSLTRQLNSFFEYEAPLVFAMVTLKLRIYVNCKL